MLNINIVHVGEFKEKYLREAAAEYEKRISAYCKFQNLAVKQALLPENPSETSIKSALFCEEKKICECLKVPSYKIALCVEGEQLSSHDFAKKIENTVSGGKSTINFVIGSSYGLSDNTKNMCDFKLSFSHMTFPHQLMRIILEEQIYRALNILNNGKYHK